MSKNFSQNIFKNNKKLNWKSLEPIRPIFTLSYLFLIRLKEIGSKNIVFVPFQIFLHL